MQNIWPPNYSEVAVQRQKRYLGLKGNDDLIRGAKAYYSTRPKEFINHWCVTYDPRNAVKARPTTLPFITFTKQNEFIDFLSYCLDEQQSGLVEKSRDIGATWLSCAFSVWLWLFVPGASIGWGSRKENLVDKIGDPDSIFEKMRILIGYLPSFFWPAGFSLKNHATYMRIINPENGATITGESGDQIGRGGRKLIYMKDESAWYERPERIEAALADNTNVQIDISSVHGTANIFARRRQSGTEWVNGEKNTSGNVNVFVFDWRDHPDKTQAWYDARRKRAEEEGLLHIFSQEVDRDYSASVEGVVIPQAWVKAAIDAHLKLDFDKDGMAISALDVADEGGDKNAFISRNGSVMVYGEAWGEGDTGETTRKALMLMKSNRSKSLQYDSIGVGAGVKAEANRLNKEGLLDGISFVPWNAAAAPLYKERRIVAGDRNTPTNRDFFSNLKAQAWWNARLRFEKTYNAVTKGEEYDPEELISISSKIKAFHALEQELSQPTYFADGKGRVAINKKPAGAKSPNMADAAIMCLWPVQEKRVLI